MIRLRKFTQEDAAIIQARFYPDMEMPQIQEMITQWNTGAFGGKAFEMLAVLCDGEIVGMVSLFEQDNGAASFGIEIAQDYRRRGIAAGAGQQALRRAAELGYRRVVSQVRKDNIASIALHKKLGFSQTDATVNRKGKPVFLYEKLL